MGQINSKPAEWLVHNQWAIIALVLIGVSSLVVGVAYLKTRIKRKNERARFQNTDAYNQQFIERDTETDSTLFGQTAVFDGQYAPGVAIPNLAQVASRRPITGGIARSNKTAAKPIFIVKIIRNFGSWLHSLRRTPATTSIELQNVGSRPGSQNPLLPTHNTPNASGRPSPTITIANLDEFLCLNNEELLQSNSDLNLAATSRNADHPVTYDNPNSAVTSETTNLAPTSENVNLPLASESLNLPVTSENTNLAAASTSATRPITFENLNLAATSENTSRPTVFDQLDRPDTSDSMESFATRKTNDTADSFGDLGLMTASTTPEQENSQDFQYLDNHRLSHVASHGSLRNLHSRNQTKITVTDVTGDSNEVPNYGNAYPNSTLTVNRPSTPTSVASNSDTNLLRVPMVIVPPRYYARGYRLSDIQINEDIPLRDHYPATTLQGFHQSVLMPGESPPRQRSDWRQSNTGFSHGNGYRGIVDEEAGGVETARRSLFSRIMRR